MNTCTIKNRATEVALFFCFRSWMNLRPLACHPRAVAAYGSFFYFTIGGSFFYCPFLLDLCTSLVALFC